MPDLIDRFFQVYWKPGMPFVYIDAIPQEMMLSEVDEAGWFQWKLIPGTLHQELYEDLGRKYDVSFPANFIEWHRRYFFLDGDCSFVRLPPSIPSLPLKEVEENLNWFIAKQLIPQGLIPFASDGNDEGPWVFDTREQKHKTDYPIRVYDHEYMREFHNGLSDIIFSSFNKMLECLIYFFSEMPDKQMHQVIPGFFDIDPSGAGDTGRTHWESWIRMAKANYDEFGY